MLLYRQERPQVIAHSFFSFCACESLSLLCVGVCLFLAHLLLRPWVRVRATIEQIAQHYRGTISDALCGLMILYCNVGVCGGVCSTPSRRKPVPTLMCAVSMEQSTCCVSSVRAMLSLAPCLVCCVQTVDINDPHWSHWWSDRLSSRLCASHTLFGKRVYACLSFIRYAFLGVIVSRSQTPDIAGTCKRGRTGLGTHGSLPAGTTLTMHWYMCWAQARVKVCAWRV